MRAPERVAAALRALPRPVCAYVYDTAAARGRAAEVRAALPPTATLLYAVKANGHPALVQALATACDGLEVASGGELALAVAAGARRIVFGGPAKTDAELAAALAAGALVNVESGHELRRLDAAARAAGRVADITVRVNRAGAALPGSHAMTGTATPFGVDERDLPDVLALAAALPAIRVHGFGLHAVSNNLDAAAHATFVAEALDWSRARAAAHRVDLRVVNVGGGLGVDYTGAAVMDLAVLRAGLAGLDLTGLDLIVEPGRILAADAGWYAAEVLDLKHTHGRWFAVLRGGTHHFRLPAAWGYSHPFTVLPVDDWPYDWARPQVSGVAVDAVGELCTPRDVLARAHPVSRLRVGDVLVFARTGAYGWDISHHDFLRHPHPRIVVL
ncbi:diaminopimelate decarboxylase [Krasilnikovia cinnamomea]|uniref:Diaminopimelate decarboxylase n=1 Tax=Krasilnikovia cinnamomea TaxID=349313 RepID=A0A4Q7ZTP7_9ACTN|nr:alanine racemase [Krasilnikovia cinnamomea]RZU54251.1 diaminopimelate decarboxylase [Krasilnikovia cinnamomea]